MDRSSIYPLGVEQYVVVGERIYNITIHPFRLLILFRLFGYFPPLQSPFPSYPIAAIHTRTTTQKQHRDHQKNRPFGGWFRLVFSTLLLPRTVLGPDPRHLARWFQPKALVDHEGVQRLVARDLVQRHFLHYYLVFCCSIIIVVLFVDGHNGFATGLVAHRDTFVRRGFAALQKLLEGGKPIQRSSRARHDFGRARRIHHDDAIRSSNRSSSKKRCEEGDPETFRSISHIVC